MEIQFNEDEVKKIILDYARKIFPEANSVSGGYSSIPQVTVSFVEEKVKYAPLPQNEYRSGTSEEPL